MIDALKGAAMLKGARGQNPADLGAIVDVLLKFSHLCLDLRGVVQEIDINPLLVLDAGQGAKAVDCLVVPVQSAYATLWRREGPQDPLRGNGQHINAYPDGISDGIRNSGGCRHIGELTDAFHV